jgi:hypothetical protein
MSVWQTNRFWYESLEHTLFFKILKLFVNMCLTVSSAGRKKAHFLDLRIKSYGCLKFQGEVWAGRACAVANEEELTTCAKLWGQGARGIPKKGPMQERSATADRSSTSGRRPLVAPSWATTERSAVARLPGDQ